MHKIQHVVTNSSAVRFNSVCVSLRRGREIRLDVVVDVLNGEEERERGREREGEREEEESIYICYMQFGHGLPDTHSYFGVYAASILVM